MTELMASLSWKAKNEFHHVENEWDFFLGNLNVAKEYNDTGTQRLSNHNRDCLHTEVLMIQQQKQHFLILGVSKWCIIVMTNWITAIFSAINLD